MITLKLDLKILGSLTAYTLILLTSCQTVRLENISIKREIPIDVVHNEYELIDIEPIVATEITSSKIIIRPEISNVDEYNLQILSYSGLSLPTISKTRFLVTNSEYPLQFLTVPKKKVVVKKVTKPVIKPIIKQVVKPSIKTAETPTIKKGSKPSTDKILAVEATKNTSQVLKKNSKPKVPIQELTPKIQPVAPKRTVIVLDEREVLLGKTFTIEMDQTGWIYENEIDNILFRNKFYTNNKVLFEFIPEKTGNSTIEFVKYTDDEQIYSTIDIDVKELIKEQVVISDKPLLIVPEKTQKSISEKSRLEKDMHEINSSKNPDEVYFGLAEIYYNEGLLKKAKEYYEYIYDNYPFSIYYDDAKDRMNYILDNFLKVR